MQILTHPVVAISGLISGNRKSQNVDLVDHLAGKSYSGEGWWRLVKVGEGLFLCQSSLSHHFRPGHILLCPLRELVGDLAAKHTSHYTPLSTSRQQRLKHSVYCVRVFFCWKQCNSLLDARWVCFFLGIFLLTKFQVVPGRKWEGVEVWWLLEVTWGPVVSDCLFTLGWIWLGS